MIALDMLSVAIKSGFGLVSETSDLIENQIPSGIIRGSKEHALFLFATVPSDRGVKSSLLWKRAAQLYNDVPWLFEPLRFIGVAEGDNTWMSVKNLIADQLKPRYAHNSTRGWVMNAARLHREFDSDPRKVFSHGRDGRSSYATIRSFFGFGPKTGGMMYRAATGLGWASTIGAQSVEVPVDTHDVRLALQLGILIPDCAVVPASYQSLAPIVRKELTDACSDAGIEWFDIDRAMWLIGSRGCASKRCSLCPLATVCSASVTPPIRSMELENLVAEQLRPIVESALHAGAGHTHNNMMD